MIIQLWENEQLGEAYHCPDRNLPDSLDEVLRENRRLLQLSEEELARSMRQPVEWTEIRIVPEDIAVSRQKEIK